MTEAKSLVSRRGCSWVLGLLVFLAGCAGSDDLAPYRKMGNRYLVEVTGKRLAVSHNLTNWGMATDFFQFDLPRIDGKIDGKEIHQRPGYYPLVGSVTISGRRMTVDLKFDNYHSHKLERFDWNGTYTLKELESGAPRTRPPFGPYAALSAMASENGAKASIHSFGTAPPYFPYTMEAAGETGRVVIRVTGGTDGIVKSAAVVQSDRSKFDEGALRTARSMIFKDVSADFSFLCEFKFSYLELDEIAKAEDVSNQTPPRSQPTHGR